MDGESFLGKRHAAFVFSAWLGTAAFSASSLPEYSDYGPPTAALEEPFIAKALAHAKGVQEEDLILECPLVLGEAIGALEARGYKRLNDPRGSQ